MSVTEHPPSGGRVARWGLAALVVLLAAGSCGGTATAAQSVDVRRAEVVAPSGRPIDGGGSATPFTLRLPDGAACPGDSANDGYRVNSYMVPLDVDPTTVTYLNAGNQWAQAVQLGEADAYHWDAATSRLLAVPKVARVPLELLQGIDDVRDILLQNTAQFASGFGANNALLWGARGMGKSSLVKAVHAQVAATVQAGRLLLIDMLQHDRAEYRQQMGHVWLGFAPGQHGRSFL